jgi:hypothetical protein
MYYPWFFSTDGIEVKYFHPDSNGIVWWKQEYSNNSGYEESYESVRCTSYIHRNGNAAIVKSVDSSDNHEIVWRYFHNVYVYRYPGGYRKYYNIEIPSVLPRFYDDPNEAKFLASDWLNNDHGIRQLFFSNTLTSRSIYQSSYPVDLYDFAVDTSQTMHIIWNESGQGIFYSTCYPTSSTVSDPFLLTSAGITAQIRVGESGDILIALPFMQNEAKVWFKPAGAAQFTYHQRDFPATYESFSSCVNNQGGVAVSGYKESTCYLWRAPTRSDPLTLYTYNSSSWKEIIDTDLFPDGNIAVLVKKQDDSHMVFLSIPTPTPTPTPRPYGAPSWRLY